MFSGAISSSPLLVPSSVLGNALDLGGSSFGVMSFCPFIPFMRLSQQVFLGGLPFPPPVDHVLSGHLKTLLPVLKEHKACVHLREQVPPLESEGKTETEMSGCSFYLFSKYCFG